MGETSLGGEYVVTLIVTHHCCIDLVTVLARTTPDKLYFVKLKGLQAILRTTSCAFDDAFGDSATTCANMFEIF